MDSEVMLIKQSIQRVSTGIKQVVVDFRLGVNVGNPGFMLN
jgi:hypothetical protein